MKIAILSGDPKLYSTRRLKEVAQARGHSVRVLAPAQFAIHIEQGKPALYFKGKPVGKYDAVIPRVSIWQANFVTAVVRQFEQMGVFCLNPSHAITVARDKLRTMQILSRHQVGIPTSASVSHQGDVEGAIERIGRAPVIVKLLQGSQGSGVMLAESNKVAEAIVEALRSVNQGVLIQKFVSESKGTDIRAFVVGDRVVAAMRRVAQGEEFRSNVHLGADTEPVELDARYERAAIQTAHILGLRVAGIDLLQAREGPQVMEANSSPGLEGIEKATGVDVASTIIEYLEDQVLFPDIDIRERLSLSRGYAVAEIPIIPKSPLIGKTLGEANLLEQEIQVLSIIRNGLPIPTPAPTEQLHSGDVLLCFGKQLSLRALLPARTKKQQLKDASNSG